MRLGADLHRASRVLRSVGVLFAGVAAVVAMLIVYDRPCECPRPAATTSTVATTTAPPSTVPTASTTVRRAPQRTSTTGQAPSTTRRPVTTTTRCELLPGVTAPAGLPCP